MTTLTQTETRYREFKRGETLMIYQDPLTRLRPEGSATLLKLIQIDEAFERWKVVFHSDGMHCERNILREVVA